MMDKTYPKHVGQVPVEQLGPEELNLLLDESPTLNVPISFSIFLLLHLGHSNFAFSALTPISKSNLLPHFLHK